MEDDGGGGFGSDNFGGDGGDGGGSGGGSGAESSWHIPVTW